MVQIIATPDDNNMTSRRSMTGLLCGSMNMSSITSFGVITSGLELHQNYSKIEAKFTLPKEEVGEVRFQVLFHCDSSHFLFFPIGPG